VSEISAFIKGDMVCAITAGPQAVSVRQIKRLKKRKREDWLGARRSMWARSPHGVAAPAANLLLEQPQKGAWHRP
jgi:hypothetical protein